MLEAASLSDRLLVLPPPCNEIFKWRIWNGHTKWTYARHDLHHRLHLCSWWRLRDSFWFSTIGSLSTFSSLTLISIDTITLSEACTTPELSAWITACSFIFVTKCRTESPHVRSLHCFFDHRNVVALFQKLPYHGLPLSSESNCTNTQPKQWSSATHPQQHPPCTYKALDPMLWTLQAPTTLSAFLNVPQKYTTLFLINIKFKRL